jgi:hypothetical protein
MSGRYCVTKQNWLPLCGDRSDLENGGRSKSGLGEKIGKPMPNIQYHNSGSGKIQNGSRKGGVKTRTVVNITARALGQGHIRVKSMDEGEKLANQGTVSIPSLTHVLQSLFLIVVLSGGTLSHLQKFLQYIKYIP